MSRLENQIGNTQLSDDNLRCNAQTESEMYKNERLLHPPLLLFAERGDGSKLRLNQASVISNRLL